MSVETENNKKAANAEAEKKPAEPKGKTFTMEEIKKHTTDEDCWVLVAGKVYDVTKFLEEHPGGPEIITDVTGEDATDEFEDVGHSKDARRQLEEHFIGTLEGYVPPPEGEKRTGSNDGGGMMMMIVPVLLVIIAVIFKMMSDE